MSAYSAARSCFGRVWGRTPIGRWIDQQGEAFRGRLALTFAAVGALNVGAWGWALASFHDHPLLLSVAGVTYGLGLRHAVDADHIAAIDNVTRKLMHAGQRPVAVGFFFAIGHASVVMAVTAAAISAASMLGAFKTLQDTGALISTSVSALFLLVIALTNMAVLTGIVRTYRKLRAGGGYRPEDLEVTLAERGLLCRLLRPLFALITRSWHMLALGALFGLSFDTATEVAVFGISAAQTAQGLPLAAVLVFPSLFAAGMVLVDTSDGMIMLGAYDWAFIRPARKLFYNMVITAMSVAVALLICMVEILGMVRQGFELQGWFWDGAGAVAGDLNILGLITIGIFIGGWAISLVLYKMWRLDEIGS